MSQHKWEMIFVFVQIKSVQGFFQKYQFLFDTGATESVISHKVLHEAGLSVRDGGGVNFALTGGGLVPGFSVKIPTIKVFDRVLLNQSIAVSDLLYNDEKETDEIDGIIGMDLIRQFRILIDGPAGKFRIQA